MPVFQYVTMSSVLNELKKYLLLDGSRKMLGNFDMNSHDINQIGGFYAINGAIFNVIGAHFLTPVMPSGVPFPYEVYVDPASEELRWYNGYLGRWVHVQLVV